MCFSVWTILKDQWKGSAIKGLYVSRLIVSWEARFQPSRRKKKNFQSVHFFFCHRRVATFHSTSKKKRRKIFCNFCASNHYTHASTRALLIWGSKKSRGRKHLQNISRVSSLLFYVRRKKTLLETSLGFTSYCFCALARPQQVRGAIEASYWATTPMRHHDGGCSSASCPSEKNLSGEKCWSIFARLLRTLDIFSKRFSFLLQLTQLFNNQFRYWETQTNHANSEPIREVEALKARGDIWKYNRVSHI